MSGKRFTNQKGMSLVEVTIAAAISVIVALGVMKINETSQKGLNSVRDSSEVEELKRNILGHLMNDQKCSASRFANGGQFNWQITGTPGGTQPPNATAALNSTTFAAAGNFFRIVTRNDGSTFEDFRVGQVVPWTNRWVLDNFRLFRIDGWDGTTDRGRCHVGMQLSKKTEGNAFGADTKEVFFSLDCQTNPAGTTMISCTALNTLSEGLWQLSEEPNTTMFASAATAVLGGGTGDRAWANLDILAPTAPNWTSTPFVGVGVRLPKNRAISFGDDGFYSTTAGKIRTNDVAKLGIGVEAHDTYKLYNNGEMLNNGWLRTLGNTGWYSETHGGGWYMIDSTWIRSYNSKNVYVDAQLRSDGGLTSLGNTQLGDTGTDVTTISGWATTGNLHSSGKVWSPLIAGARVHSSGDITGLNRLFLTAGSYASNHYSASDERYKKDIETIESASEKLSEIRGVTYLLRRDEFPEMQFSEGRQTGFIAQEIQKTFPELVVENPRTGYLNVDYSKFTAVLVEAFKEQQAIIAKNKEMFEIMRDGMNAKNAEQDARIEKLEQENKELRDEVRALSRRLDEIIKKLED